MEKEIVTIRINGLTHDGRGVGKYNGLAVFIATALPGELVTAMITVKKKNYAEAELLEIVQASPHRIKPKCSIYEECGGCQLLHLEYKQQLLEKTKLVENNLMKIADMKQPKVKPCLGMKHTLGYRNKIAYQVGGKKGSLQLGFFRPKSNHFVAGFHCLLISPVMSQIAEEVEKQINIHAVDGLHQILIRQSQHSQETLLGLVFKDKNKDRQKQYKDFVDRLTAKFPKLISVVEMYNADLSIPWQGDGSFFETIADKRFKISATSFFQINSLQAAELFKLAVSYCKEIKDKSILDLYCGTGSFSLFLADGAHKVYGIESNPSAVYDAKANAELNHLENIEFILGKAEVVAPLLIKKGVNPNIVVVDPPRKGCYPQLLELLLEIKAERLIYVSCDPATLARDLKVLATGYEVVEVQPIDMFPHTPHVECVVLMSRVKE